MKKKRIRKAPISPAILKYLALGFPDNQDDIEFFECLALSTKQKRIIYDNHKAEVDALAIGTPFFKTELKQRGL